MKAPKAILFDWDGTLADTMACVLSGHNAVRRHFDLPEWEMEDYVSNIAHQSSREAYTGLYDDRADEALKVLYDHIGAVHIEKLELLPGAQELADFLAHADIPVGVLSNKRHAFLLDEIAHLGWSSLFFSIVGAGYAEKDKPDPAPFHKALAEGGVDCAPEDVWYVGDSIADMQLARNVGCSAILVGAGDKKKKLVAEFDPVGVFNSCHDLQSALASSIHRR